MIGGADFFAASGCPSFVQSVAICHASVSTGAARAKPVGRGASCNLCVLHYGVTVASRTGRLFDGRAVEIGRRVGIGAA